MKLKISIWLSRFIWWNNTIESKKFIELNNTLSNISYFEEHVIWDPKQKFSTVVMISGGRYHATARSIYREDQHHTFCSLYVCFFGSTHIICWLWTAIENGRYDRDGLLGALVYRMINFFLEVFLASHPSGCIFASTFAQQNAERQ